MVYIILFKVTLTLIKSLTPIQVYLHVQSLGTINFSMLDVLITKYRNTRYEKHIRARNRFLHL